MQILHLGFCQKRHFYCFSMLKLQHIEENYHKRCSTSGYSYFTTMSYCFLMQIFPLGVKNHCFSMLKVQYITSLL